jgi:hypothetical protein
MSHATPSFRVWGLGLGFRLRVYKKAKEVKYSCLRQESVLGVTYSRLQQESVLGFPLGTHPYKLALSPKPEGGSIRSPRMCKGLNPKPYTLNLGFTKSSIRSPRMCAGPKKNKKSKPGIHEGLDKIAENVCGPQGLF